MAEQMAEHQMLRWAGYAVLVVLSVWFVYEYLGMRLGEATAKKTVRYGRLGIPRSDDLDEFGRRHHRRFVVILMIAYGIGAIVFANRFFGWWHP